ncbi:retrovirus-related Pol polyprotein from transposon opus [Trichonephila clavipes]|nr:retrovirus-related Pol polyprotein from transposon opus [Trichonephila clavipes]
MVKEVKAYCSYCHGCQLRKVIRSVDKIPITPVSRPELPFQVVNVDLIGPVDPVSSQGDKYMLCLMDQHSRWPEAIPLKSLTPKSTCEALLEIFSRTGIPEMAGGNLRLLHVNKIRKYRARVQTVGVVYDIDDEFGEIYETPTKFL